jgi:hypothetical protein
MAEARTVSAMPATVVPLSTASALLALMVLAGLIVRKRADACFSFVAYLASAAIGHTLLAACPRTFWTWEFLFITDAIQTGLCVAIAFEIALKAFRPLPVGYRKVRGLLTVIAAATAVLVLLFPGQTADAFDLTRVVSRVSYGVAFLFGAFVALTWYHGVPVDPVQRDIAIGFGYLTMLSAFTGVLSTLDPILGWGRYVVVKFSYPALLIWWAWRAWGREPRTVLTRETMEILQPWRVKRIRWE